MPDYREVAHGRADRGESGVAHEGHQPCRHSHIQFSIGGIVGFGLWFWLIARCSMGASHRSACCFRCFAFDFERFVLGDRMTPKLIVGGLLRSRRRHYTSKIDRLTNLNLEVASW